MDVLTLTRAHESSLSSLLHRDPIQNLFLLGFLDTMSLGKGYWTGTVGTEGSVTGVVLGLHQRLVVPFCPNAGDALRIADALAGRGLPQMLVGPRDACDALWATWSHGVTANRWYDQRLYVCLDAPDGLGIEGLRQATLDDAPIIEEFAGRMEEEDLGRNPAKLQPDMHRQVVRERIRNGKTWVVEERGELVFTINVGTAIALGCQVGGTYVPPHRRGEGIAVRAMRELCRRLLVRHGMVTLHVNEANLPAVRTYERSGFEAHAAFRLATVWS